MKYRPGELRLRQAGPGDSAVIAALELRSVVHEPRMQPLVISEPEFTDIWRERLTTGTHQTLLAEDGDRTVGFLSLASPVAHGEVQTLYIEPECFRRGIGTVLMNAAQDIVFAAGGRCLYVEAEILNTRGIRFYLGLGFSTDRLLADTMKVILKKQFDAGCNLQRV